jgi:FKBP-type peptidyl-prolyl cis-trans isomerase FklB
MSLHDKLRSHRTEQVNKEKEEGRAFLEKNRQAEGVQELPGGIQYQVIQEGTGPRPQLKDTITAHYAGRLLSGKEFDSSFRRGQPFTARITALIRGWQQVLPMMPTGSRWRIWIPSDLAYGDSGTGGIPGGATLEFEIELLQIK